MVLSKDEHLRYDRQIMIPEIGAMGQEKLRNSRVFIAGAGGLGSPVALYLAAAGVGFLRIVDNDKVETSNLNRQILHWHEDVGRKKVVSARDKLVQLNPYVTIEALDITIEEGNVLEITKDVDAVVDAMDNLDTRFLLNRAALQTGVPFFHGAVRGFEGRAMTIIPGKTACLRCMRQGSIAPEKFPVIGVAPAVIGCIQATEVIKYLLGMGMLLAGRLLIYDGTTMTFEEFAVNRNPHCDHCFEIEGKRE